MWGMGSWWNQRANGWRTASYLGHFFTWRGVWQSWGLCGTCICLKPWSTSLSSSAHYLSLAAIYFPKILMWKKKLTHCRNPLEFFLFSSLTYTNWHCLKLKKSKNPGWMTSTMVFKVWYPLALQGWKKGDRSSDQLAHYNINRAKLF